MWEGYYLDKKYWKQKPKIDVARDVLKRYWKVKKITILSGKEYYKARKEFWDLCKKRDRRKWNYRGIMTYGLDYGGPIGVAGWNVVWILGEIYSVSDENLSVLKSILRQLRKLDKLQEDTTWQRLVQQAI